MWHRSAPDPGNVTDKNATEISGLAMSWPALGPQGWRCKNLELFAITRDGSGFTSSKLEASPTPMWRTSRWGQAPTQVVATSTSLTQRNPNSRKEVQVIRLPDSNTTTMIRDAEAIMVDLTSRKVLSVLTFRPMDCKSPFYVEIELEAPQKCFTSTWPASARISS